MKYFLDTEFNEYDNIIDLISIGVVSEDNREYYAISKEFNIKLANKNQWLVDNVLNNLPKENVNFSDWGLSPRIKEEALLWKNRSEIKRDIINFMLNDQNPEFWGYYSSYDWVCFCKIFGKMIDLPEKFPMYCNDLKQLMKQLGNPKNMPIQFETKGNHHALLGARWNKLAFDYLDELWNLWNTE